jgi:hypothetical protein
MLTTVLSDSTKGDVMPYLSSDAGSATDSTIGTIPVDAPVQVRNRFDGHWSRGFTLAEVINTPEHDRYRVRRVADGAVLPARFTGEDIAQDPGPRRPR